MNRERFDELKDAFVLRALPEEERREFEQYLAEHPERQAEIDELDTVAGLLALSPQEHEPPPGLRRRILDVVEAEEGSPRVESRSWLARMRESLGVRELALGAAALLVIVLFGWNLSLQRENNDLEGRVQSLQDQPEVVALRGAGVARGAKAEVMILHDERAILVAENMPPVPKDKTLQIWVIANDVPQPGGVFEPAEKVVAVMVAKPVAEADAIAVTVEPHGGSRKPTTRPMLTAKL